MRVRDPQRHHVPVLILVTLTLITPSIALAFEDARGGADDPWLDENVGRYVMLYKSLHAHPELSFEEKQTSRRIADELREAGFQVTERVGGYGVVAVLENGDGPTVLVRTDLDALPIVEQTGLPYASKVTVEGSDGASVGVMHACGHDMHMANLIGTADWLASHREAWSGTVVLIGQPAEERVGGAKAMLADGLYTRFPQPDFALALHVNDNLAIGRVGYVPGPAYASVSSVDIIVRGVGGHGAKPHQAIDPIVLASLLVLDLQTIVSREVKPIDPAVLTVGSIHGGSKHNIIPAEVRLQLTLRSYSESVMDQLISGIRRRAEALAIAHQAPEPTVSVSENTPPTINHPDLVDRVVPAFERVLGSANVEPLEPTMGAEDFGRYATNGVPIFMYSLGSVDPARILEAESGGDPLPSVHSPFYAPVPEPTLRTAIATMTAAVTELLPPASVTSRD